VAAALPNSISRLSIATPSLDPTAYGILAPIIAILSRPVARSLYDMNTIREISESAVRANELASTVDYQI
jgi:hypothetical protein